MPCRNRARVWCHRRSGCNDRCPLFVLYLNDRGSVFPDEPIGGLSGLPKISRRRPTIPGSAGPVTNRIRESALWAAEPRSIARFSPIQAALIATPRKIGCFFARTGRDTLTSRPAVAPYCHPSIRSAAYEGSRRPNSGEARSVYRKTRQAPQIAAFDAVFHTRRDVLDNFATL